MSNFLRIDKKRVEQVLPSHIKESDVLSNNAKKVFAALLDLHFSLDEPKKIGYVYLTNDELRKIVQIQKNAMLSAVRELTDLQHPLIRREAGKSRNKGERAQATRYYINWNNINFPLVKLTFAGFYEQFVKPLEKPTGTVDIDKEKEIDLEKEIEIDLEKDIDKNRKNKKVEIKKDFSLKKDTLKMEFENEFKNEFENEIENDNTKTKKRVIEVKKGNNLNTSILLKNDTKEKINVDTKTLENIYEEKTIKSRITDDTNTIKTSSSAGNSPTSVDNLKGGELPRSQQNKTLDAKRISKKTNGDTKGEEIEKELIQMGLLELEDIETNDTKADANKCAMSNENANDGIDTKTDVNKLLERQEIALNSIFNVICDWSEQDLQEMNRPFEQEETNQFADEQEKAMQYSAEQQREYQEERQEQQVQKENALNYKEVFEEYENKIKYCKTTESLNAIYSHFKKYAQQVAEKLDGLALEQAAEQYEQVKQAKENKMFSLKAKSIQF